MTPNEKLSDPESLDMVDCTLVRNESGKDDSNQSQPTFLRKRDPWPESDLQIAPLRAYHNQSFRLYHDLEADELHYFNGKKKRGRHLQSDPLEKYLRDKIKTECIPRQFIPDRVWISHEARKFTGQNNVDLKCSKGWLDKFMKRNSDLINPGEL